VGDGVRCCGVEKPRTLRSDYPDHPTALHLTVLHPHINPLFRAWAATPAYGTDGPRAEDPAHVQNRRFTFEQGTAPDREHPQPRAHQGARQSPITGNIPKRRPPRPQQPIFGMFRRGGLRFGHIIPRSRSPRRGKWRHENTDMPKERSSCCKIPALLMRERSEHHNENSTFSQHVLSVLVVGYPPSTPTFPYQHAENSPASNT